MRWLDEPERTEYYTGKSTRIITRFLWYPMELAGIWRWLEKVKYREVYDHRARSRGFFRTKVKDTWYPEYPEKWLDLS